MDRREINPWPWSLDFGFNQAVEVTGAERVLHCSGQTSMSPAGEVQHAGDMAAQLGLCVDNLATVLADAGMGLDNIVRLDLFTTDLDAFMESYGVVAARLGEARFASTLVGVTQLAMPGLLVEIKATAVA